MIYASSNLTCDSVKVVKKTPSKKPHACISASQRRARFFAVPHGNHFLPYLRDSGVVA